MTIYDDQWRDFSGDVQLLNLRRAWMFTFIGLSFTLSTVHVWTTIYSFVFFIFAAGIWMISALPKTGNEESPDSGPDNGPDTPTMPTTPTASRYSRFPTRAARQ